MITLFSFRHNLVQFLLKFSLAFTLLFTTLLLALPSQAQSTLGYQAGVFVGPLLSQDVTGVSEIVQLTGLRFSHPLWTTNLEYQVSAGNASNISYRLISVQLRQPLDFEFMKMHWMLGLDAHSYKFNGSPSVSKSPLGWHAGFGTQLDLSSQFHLRTDLQFGLSPGLQLLLNFGFGFAF